MEQVVEVDLPVPLRVGGQGQINAGDLARDILPQHPTVGVRGPGATHLPSADGLIPEMRIGRNPLAALIVLWALEGEVLGRRCVEEERHQRIAPTVLVDGRCPVADPLTGHEHGHRAVELELHHLDGSGMAVSLQVADESPRRGLLAGAISIAHPGGALDVLIGAHVIHERHKAVVEHGKVASEDLFSGRDSGAFGFHRWGASSGGSRGVAGDRGDRRESPESHDTTPSSMWSERA